MLELIAATDVHPIVSGFYKMAENERIAAVRDWEAEHFVRHGTFKFLTPADVEAYAHKTGLRFMEVAYAGMGF